MDDLVGRLKEPSTYTAVAVLAYAFFPDIDLAYVKEVLVGALAVVGVFLKEQGK